MTYQPGL